MSHTTDDRARLGLRESATFDRQTIAAIHRAAETGIYDIRGWGAKRALPHFDDLLFLGASMSRYPLEGYRERCDTDVVLGDRHAKHPLHLDIPVTIAGMSFGALSGPAKEALGRGASEVGTSTTTGDGGMTPEERGQSKYLVYQYLPSRYGMNPDDLRKADAIEVVLGQGAKPGGGGMLLGQKISPRVAGMRTLPEGIDQRSACRHPDWTGPDDLTIKINELREITDWEKPIYVKVGATRTYYDVKLAVHAGADVVVVDGMQGGTAATQEVFIEHVGIPTLAAVPEAVRALQELDVHSHGEGAADRVRRYPHRRGRRQGDRARRRRRRDRHRRPDRVGRQPSSPRVRVPEAGQRRGLLRRLPGRHRPGGHQHAGPRAGGAVRPPRRRPQARQLSTGADDGGTDHRACLRQSACAAPRTGGSGRGDHRSGSHGARSVGGDGLDSGAQHERDGRRRDRRRRHRGRGGRMGAEPTRRHRCGCRRTQHRRIGHDGQVQWHRAVPLRGELVGRDGDRRPRGVREGRRHLRHRHRVPADRLRRRRRRAQRRVDAQKPGRTAGGRRADRGDRPLRCRADVAVRRPCAVRGVRLGVARRIRRRLHDRAGLRGLGAGGGCPGPPGNHGDGPGGRR